MSNAQPSILDFRKECELHEERRSGTVPLYYMDRREIGFAKDNRDLLEPAAAFGTRRTRCARNSRNNFGLIDSASSVEQHPVHSEKSS